MPAEARAQPDWAAAIVRAFPGLDPALQNAQTRLVHAAADTVAQWRAAVDRAFHANLGAEVLAQILALTAVCGEAALPAVRAATHIGLHCGARIAADFLRQWRQLAEAPRDAEGWELGCERLAQAAPDCVPVLVRHLLHLAGRLDGQRFFSWVQAGLRAHAHDRAARLAFFDLKDALACDLLAREGREGDFGRLEKRLRGGLAALWNERRQLSALAPAAGPIPRRVSMAGGVLRFPQAYPGYGESRAESLYRAACAHAGAHYRYSTRTFPVGTLKPLQVVLVSLIEDARVEALAIRDYPGLAGLWRTFHTADAANAGATATGLMTRLARALLDPAYTDDDGWISKGRALFQASRPRLADAQISREIGGLLGADLGQMRLQFNIKTYVVQPEYRDDNLALWDFPASADAPQDTIEIRAEPSGAAEGGTRAATVIEMDGAPIARYPEWDYAIGQARPDWVTVRHRAPQIAPLRTPDAEDLSARVLRVTRSRPVGRRARRKRLLEGEMLDLDAAVAAALARRMNRPPDERIFQRSVAGRRDLAALLLLDLSQSTADRDAQGRSVLALERDAAFAVGRAMALAGDDLAIDGFCSDGRAQVHYTSLKSFDEPFTDLVAARLAGVTSGYSTRLGAALRHAGGRLEKTRAFRRVLLVLTDGEPSDIDVADPQYLKQDARRAVLELRHNGIDAFGLGIGAQPSAALAEIFGPKRALHVPRAAVLPARLVRLYEELKN